MARVFYKISENVREAIIKKINLGYGQFKVKMADGDYYYIDADDKSVACAYADEIHRCKIEAAKKVLSYGNPEPFENFMSEYGNGIGKVKSVEQVQKNDMIPIKSRKVLDWYKSSEKKIGMKRIASAEDDEDVTFKDCVL